MKIDGPFLFLNEALKPIIMLNLINKIKSISGRINTYKQLKFIYFYSYEEDLKLMILGQKHNNDFNIIIDCELLMNKFDINRDNKLMRYLQSNNLSKNKEAINYINENITKEIVLESNINIKYETVIA